ncbi:LysE family translocator [Halomonas binhaiensis]|uniref:LysE family translocator n=1 Tax=Halomonas binhaiensis TaxID=2562282 RepID=A0A5C1NC07_9GAMM|nr:LysE family translocator [Halomonas binhaiensis]QEM80896.1 LysE family translocator [Halomonas binhaiensis]
MSLEFLLTSLVVVLLPGTGVLYTLAIGLGRGFKASIAAALGCTLGIVPAALASIVGLAALLHTSALAFQLIKYLGVIYLLYMAWKILHDKGLMEVPENDVAESGASKNGVPENGVPENKEKAGLVRVATNGTLLNILNPKLSLFFLAFLPQFVSPDTLHPTASLVGLALVFMAMTFVVFVVYGAFAAYARDYVIQRPSVMRWIKRSFAGVFGFLGIKLALSN